MIYYKYVSIITVEICSVST